MTTEDRFWNKIKIMPNGCWLWTGAIHKNYYGSFYDGVKNIMSHRYSYVHNIGFITSDQKIIHQCDNPSCVNYDHMRIGTQYDNIRDKVNKGRHLIGIDSPNAKLSESEVEEILLSKDRVVALAVRYKTQPGNISRIKTGSRWSHIRPDIKRTKYKKEIK